MLSLNVSSFFTRQAADQAKSVGKVAERLSSAQRVNRASDDAAGLSIAESLRTQVRGSQQAARNIQNGINLLQFGLDGVEETFPILQRLRELVLQAANDTNTSEALGAIQGEIDSIKRQIPEAFRIGRQSRLMFDGTPSDRMLDFQVGANSGQTLTTDFNPLRTELLKTIAGAFGYTELYNSEYVDMATSITATFPPPPPNPVLESILPKKLVVDPNTEENIGTALTFLDESLQGLIDQAGYLGAHVNRLEHTLNTVTNYAMEMASSESKIRDTDMAADMAALTKAQILSDSSVAMVAQSNIKPMLLLEFVLNSAGEAAPAEPAEG